MKGSVFVICDQNGRTLFLFTFFIVFMARPANRPAGRTAHETKEIEEQQFVAIKQRLEGK